MSSNNRYGGGSNPNWNQQQAGGQVPGQAWQGGSNPYGQQPQVGGYGASSTGVSPQYVAPPPHHSLPPQHRVQPGNRWDTSATAAGHQWKPVVPGMENTTSAHNPSGQADWSRWGGSGTVPHHQQHVQPQSSFHHQQQQMQAWATGGNQLLPPPPVKTISSLPPPPQGMSQPNLPPPSQPMAEADAPRSRGRRRRFHDGPSRDEAQNQGMGMSDDMECSSNSSASAKGKLERAGYSSGDNSSSEDDFHYRKRSVSADAGYPSKKVARRAKNKSYKRESRISALLEEKKPNSSLLVQSIQSSGPDEKVKFTSPLTRSFNEVSYRGQPVKSSPNKSRKSSSPPTQAKMEPRANPEMVTTRNDPASKPTNPNLSEDMKKMMDDGSYSASSSSSRITRGRMMSATIQHNVEILKKKLELKKSMLELRGRRQEASKEVERKADELLAALNGTKTTATPLTKEELIQRHEQVMRLKDKSFVKHLVVKQQHILTQQKERVKENALALLNCDMKLQDGMEGSQQADELIADLNVRLPVLEEMICNAAEKLITSRQSLHEAKARAKLRS